MQKTLVKPHPKFLLTPHQSGYWVKKILGKTYYIGPCGATPEVALDEWKRTKDDFEGKLFNGPMRTMSTPANTSWALLEQALQWPVSPQSILLR